LKEYGSWLNFVAFRWFSRGSGGGTSFVPAATGICVGVTALVVIMAIMNGFQLGFIESVLEVDSYHVRVEYTDSIDIAALRDIPGVRSVLPFSEYQTMLKNEYGVMQPVKVKVVPTDFGSFDPSLIQQLNLAAGGFENSGNIILGNELARQLRVTTGDPLMMLFLNASEEFGLSSELVDLKVDRIFSSSYYEFDSGLVFIPAGLPALRNTHLDTYLGIKLNDRFADLEVVNRLVQAGIPAESIQSWRVYNKAFFGALRMEKTVMLILVGIIFLVVGVNIFYAMRKSIHERIDEIAIIKAMGCRLYTVQRIFLLNGMITGLSGALSGLMLGLLITVNINSIFAFLEAASFFLAGLFGAVGFRFFSPDIFYLTEVPVRIVFIEVLFIALAGCLSAIIAAWVSSGRIAQFHPAEVLRHE